MVETEQPVGEHQTDRKGERGLSSASTQALSAKIAHLRAPWITNQLFHQLFSAVACAPSTPTLLNTGWKSAASAWFKGRSWELGIFSFLLGRSLCLLLGRLLRGNGTKAWLRRQTSPLCTKQTLHGFTLPILFTSQTLFGVFGLFGWPGRLVAAGGDSLGGRTGFQAVWVWCGLVFVWVCIDCSFFVFRWLDGLVAVVSLWWFRLADEESGVWCSGQHPVCGEQHSAQRLQWNTRWVSHLSDAHCTCADSFKVGLWPVKRFLILLPEFWGDNLFLLQPWIAQNTLHAFHLLYHAFGLPLAGKIVWCLQ